MQKWEYMTIREHSSGFYINEEKVKKKFLENTPIHETLNEYGNQGWALVDVDNSGPITDYYLKRPLEPEDL
jgi:hypothetical protein